MHLCGTVQAKAATESAVDDPRYKGVMRSLRGSLDGGLARSCFVSTEHKVADYVLQLHDGLGSFNKCL